MSLPYSAEVTTTNTSNSVGSPRSYSSTAREMAAMRNQIMESFLASNKLLSDIDLNDEDSNAALTTSKRTTDLLVKQLSSDQLDMHMDLTAIMESYKNGQITSDQLEFMIKSEQDRSAFLMKVSLAMKMQLESIFENYSSMADKVESGHTVDSSEINTIFLDCNEAINTAQLMGDVMQTPARKLQHAISCIDEQISSIASTALKRAHAARRLHSDTHTSQPEPLVPIPRPQSAINDDHPDDDISVHSQQSEQSLKTISLSKVRIRSDAGCQTELSGDATPLQAIEPSPLKTVTRTEPSAGGDIGYSSDSTLYNDAPNLRIDGLKAKRTDRKEKEKAAALLMEKEASLRVLEQELAQQQSFLDVRTGELLRMSQKVASYERALQQHSIKLEEEFTKKVQTVNELASLSRTTSTKESTLAQSGAIENSTTESFVEQGLEAAIAAHARTISEELKLMTSIPFHSGAQEIEHELGRVADLYIRGGAMQMHRSSAPGHMSIEKGYGSSRPSSQSVAMRDSEKAYGETQLSRRATNSLSPIHGVRDRGHIGDEFVDELSTVSRISLSTKHEKDYDGLTGSRDSPGHEDFHASFGGLHGMGVGLTPPPPSQSPTYPHPPKNELIVIYPASKDDKGTCTADFKAYLYEYFQSKDSLGGGGRQDPPSVGVAVGVAVSHHKKKRAKEASENAPAKSNSTAGGGADGITSFMDDSDNEGGEFSPKKSTAQKLHRLDQQSIHSLPTQKSDGGLISANGTATANELVRELSATMGATGRGISIIKVGPKIAQNDRTGPQSRSALPIISTHPMGLTTRTYNPRPAQDVYKLLADSENPLVTLLEVYSDVLSDVHKGLLFEAAAGASLGRTVSHVDKLFRPMVAPLCKIDASALALLKELSVCEDLAGSLIVLLDSGEVPASTFRRSLAQLHSQLATIESTRIWIDVQLVSYRTIFERVQALRITMLGDLSRNCASFKECMEIYMSSQSRAVEIQHRLEATKDRCIRYRLADPAIWRNLASNAQGVGGTAFSVHPQGAESGSVSLNDALALEDEVQRLTMELNAAQEEAEEMNLEVLRVMQEGDRTPGALQFFAALHDPVTISVIQQLVLQLGSLKGFTDGSAHIDFPEVRKRLQVCISCIPSIDRFVQRYSQLHKKWTMSRLGVFTSKGLTGGSGDAANLCPLCSNDSRVFAPSANGMMSRLDRQLGRAGGPPNTLEHHLHKQQAMRSKKMDQISNRLHGAEMVADRVGTANTNRTSMTDMTDRTASYMDRSLGQSVLVGQGRRK